MAKPSGHELLYNAVKLILKWHVRHEKNVHALEAYSSLLDRMEKLERIHNDFGKSKEIKADPAAILADLKKIIDETKGARMSIIKITKGEPVQ